MHESAIAALATRAPRAVRRPSLAVAAATVVLLASAAACASDTRTPAADSASAAMGAMPANGGAPMPATPAATGMPPAVEALGHHSENAYDMAKMNDWAKARASVDSLTAAVAALPTASGASEDRGELREALGELDKAVTSRDRAAGMRAANHLTALGARASTSYNPVVPVSVTMLDYYGRELEIWSAAKDMGRLRETAAAMRQEWDGLRPQLEARGGTAESQRFGALVTRVDAAATPAAYAALATPVLDEVDKLEAVFKK